MWAKPRSPPGRPRSWKPRPRHRNRHRPDPLTASYDFLGTAYQIATAADAYAASGTTKGQWVASIITLKTS
jgi:hypothetical protein